MKLSDKHNKYSTTSELFDINTEVEILSNIQDQIGNITSACFRFINEKNPLCTEQDYLIILSELGKLNTIIDKTIPEMKILALRHPAEKSANFATIKYNRTKLMDIVRRLNVLFELEKEDNAFAKEYLYEQEKVFDAHTGKIVSFLDYYQTQTGENLSSMSVSEKNAHETLEPKHTPLSSLLFAQALNEQKMYESFLENMQMIGTKDTFFAQLQRPYHDLNQALLTHDPLVAQYIEECAQVRKKFEDIFKVSLATLKTPISLDKTQDDAHLVSARSDQKISRKSAQELREQLSAVTRSMEAARSTVESYAKTAEASTSVTQYFKYARRALLTTLGATMGAAFAYGPAKEFATPKVPPKHEDALVEKNVHNDPVEAPFVKKQQTPEISTVASQKVLEQMLHEMTDRNVLKGVHIGSYAPDGQVYVPFTLDEMKVQNPSFARAVEVSQKVEVVALYKKDKKIQYVEGVQYGNGHWSVKPEGFVPITVAMKVTHKDGTNAYYGVGSMHTPRVMVPEMKKESQVLFNEYIDHGVRNAKNAVEKKEAFTPPRVVHTPVAATPLHTTIEEGVRNAKGEEAPKGLWAKTKNLLGTAAKKVGSFWK